MKIERSNPPGLAAPPGGIYSHLVKAGGLLYISGQIARDVNGNLVGAGDIIAQYRQVWANLECALAGAGLNLGHLLKTTTYVVGEQNIPAMRQVRKELTPPEPPTSTMVVVAALAVAGALVEVEAVALCDG